MDRHIQGHEAGHVLTVDGTAPRSQWVTSYPPDPPPAPAPAPDPEEKTGKGPSVDETATRSQWVSKYKPAKSLAVSHHWVCRLLASDRIVTQC